MKQKRLLIFGAGVIGSIYAGKLALAGHKVTVLARNKRLIELQEKGLLLKSAQQKNITKVNVSIISELSDYDLYDYVFVILRKDHLDSALPILRPNKSKNFVFMVNTPSGYSDLINSVGESRVIPAFPGAGGKIEDGIVHYTLTSRFIQFTTLGEINGKRTTRILELQDCLRTAGFPVAISRNMDSWQKSHVAMVCPLAYGIYYDGDNNYTLAKNKVAINQMNLALKETFYFLKHSGFGITPPKLNMFGMIPVSILNFLFPFIFNTKWAETVISNHALSGRGEMEMLSRDFIALAESKGCDLVELKKLNKNQSTTVFNQH
ncbi:MAG: ketopantoate reductase family protein [Bacteroidia bacterium]|nr:ketopantoate reductase family protein [Bacteroidia bacterium]